MIESYGLILPFIQKINTAVGAVAEKYKKGHIADEDDFTSHLLGKIESELNGWEHWDKKFRKIVFQVRKTTSRGPRTEEAIFGADIVAVVNIDLSDYKKKKEFLFKRSDWIVERSSS